MTKVQWNDSLSVGVPLIDEQHKSLIERLNSMAAAVKDRQGEREIANTLSFLIQYADFHFTAEEKHMAAAAYPGLPQHRAKHEEYMLTLNELEQDFEEEGSTKPLAKALKAFLGSWLVNHIRTVDQEFGRYLAEKGLHIGPE